MRSGLRILQRWISFYLYATILSSLWDEAHAQRIKQGCYDANPLSCDPEMSVLATIEASRLGDVDVEEVCYRLATEVLPPENDPFELELHPQYLNAIEASTEFCDQVQMAYPHCLFCTEDWDLVHFCGFESSAIACGGKASLEEIFLEDYLFQTPEQLDEMCEKLDRSLERPSWDPAWEDDPFPTTIALCEEMLLAGHLCPGRCSNGDPCFNEELYPPSCNPDDYQGFYNDTWDISSLCTDIVKDAFFWADIDTIMNTSNHLEYLALYQENTTECDQMRQAYSQCFFCADEQCFDPVNNPPTCEPPYDTMTGLQQPSWLDANLTWDDFHEVDYLCYEMFFTYLNTSNINSPTDGPHLPGNTTQCTDARSFLHHCFWCAPYDEYADAFCSDGEYCENVDNYTIPDGFVSILWRHLNTTTPPEESCEELFELFEETWTSPFTQQGCYEEIYLAGICPDQFCPQADEAVLDRDYLGASSIAQKWALVWVSRVAAVLSFFGASVILYDILSVEKRRKMVYYQLLIGMAVFDIVTAAAWSFATAPIDTEVAGYIQGAIGNEATCKAQGFFIQLGFTSIFYNGSLGVYYVLVIANDWREFHLLKIRNYLHAVPVTLGLGLAFGGLPSYYPMDYACHLLPPPGGKLWPVLVFVVLPLGISIVFITGSMLLVYWKVRQRALASRKWSLALGQSNSMERQVFYQCLFYVSAFYVTWPIMFAVYLASIDVNGPLGFTLTVAFVAPLQGFSNMLVYVRPKVFSGKRKERSANASETSSVRATVARVMDLSHRRLSRMSASVSTMASSVKSSLHSSRVSTRSFARRRERLERIERMEELEEFLEPSALVALQPKHTIREISFRSSDGGRRMSDSGDRAVMRNRSDLAAVLEENDESSQNAASDDAGSRGYAFSDISLGSGFSLGSDSDNESDSESDHINNGNDKINDKVSSGSQSENERESLNDTKPATMDDKSAMVPGTSECALLPVPYVEDPTEASIESWKERERESLSRLQHDLTSIATAMDPKLKGFFDILTTSVKAHDPDQDSYSSYDYEGPEQPLPSMEPIEMTLAHSEHVSISLPPCNLITTKSKSVHPEPETTSVPPESAKANGDLVRPNTRGSFRIEKDKPLPSFAHESWRQWL